MSHEHDTPVTRRQVLAAGLVGAAAVTGALAGLGDGSEVEARPMNQPGPQPSAAKRMPVAFLPHGGGPWPFVELGFGSKAEMQSLAAYLRSVRGLPGAQPKALLVVSAHWEEAVPTVSTSPKPPMLYDYYGFPPESYRIQWPAPGSPQLAARVRELLGKAGVQTKEDAQRGFDHGTFVPLKLTYPDADVPVVQLSLRRGLDPQEHLAMGRALAPLRDEGVFLVGSGMTYHNMRGFFDGRSGPVAEQFDAWLRHATTRGATERDRLLTEWSKAPAARQAHPREEHLLPLMVMAGAAGADVGTVAWNGTFAGLRLSAYHFG